MPPCYALSSRNEFYLELYLFFLCDRGQRNFSFVLISWLEVDKLTPYSGAVSK